MFLTTLILGAFATFVVVGLVKLALYTWDKLINWFLQWKNGHSHIDEDAVGFTVKEALRTGDYKSVRGIFNKATNRVEDAERVQAEDIDQDVRENVFDKKVTIFE